MPTGTCRYPDHHRGPGAGVPVAWVVILATGAVIVANWHALVVALVVTVALVALGVPVLLLLHNHKRYYDPELERRAELEQRKTAATAELRPPVVHNHLHLHGVRPADVPATTARQRDLHGTTSGHPAYIAEHQ